MRESSPYKTIFTSDTNCNFGEGVLKINFGERVLNLLEGLRELTEICYTHGYGLLQRKEEDEIQPREETCKAEPRNVRNVDFSVVLLGSQDRVCLLALMCGNAYRVSPIGETHPSLSVQNFYQDSIMWA